MAATATTASQGIRQRLQGSASRVARVKRVDRLATLTITLGGLLIIVAVLFIFVFILGQAYPLFRPAEARSRGSLGLAARAGLGGAASPALVIGVDEYQKYLYELRPDGRIVFFELGTGRVKQESRLPNLGGAPLVSASRSLTGDYLAAGTADGRVALAQVRFRPRYENQGLVDLELEVHDRGTVTIDPAGRPVKEVSYNEREGRRALAAVLGDEELAVLCVDENEVERRGTLRIAGEAITHARLSHTDGLLVATAQGNLHYFELAPEFRELESAHASKRPITALEFALGDNSALLGDDQGNLAVWFRVRRREEDTELQLVMAHALPAQGSAIRAIGCSARDKSFVTAGADGSLVLRHATSERTPLSLPASGTAITAVLITPKSDGIIAQTAKGQLLAFDVRSPHPEISWAVLFSKIWYEGYPRPEYAWQSTGATDAFEAKFSLVPLIFGTIKGTFYALVFAVPLAIMGALYTSQFMHPSLKARVKPTVELMAALPSVVVGFIAGLWLAGRVERNLVPVLLMGLLLPLFGTAGVLFYDHIPLAIRGRLRLGTELALILPLLALGGLAAAALGPFVEARLFAGDFRLWLKQGFELVYDQRNCLVVGIAMGFAVIPIIFTIAEDAFTSVPSHLSAASLALGASRWQTAISVVLPTASPGIFSAVMIGFGRAVGETMIVLMATGNTPVLDWSVFNGMRTLSANIAVEIAEAPYAGTLYRTLFLAALALFGMTFLVNTLAELVRQRLRERYRAS